MSIKEMVQKEIDHIKLGMACKPDLNCESNAHGGWITCWRTEEQIEKAAKQSVFYRLVSGDSFDTWMDYRKGKKTLDEALGVDYKAREKVRFLIYA